MRRLMMLLCAGTLVLSALLSASRAAAAPAKYLSLCWLAEDARGITGKVFRLKKYAEDSSTAVAGWKYGKHHVLEIPKIPKGEKVKPDEVFYRVRIPETGTYYFWGRTLWSTGCDHSFTLKMEGFRGEWVLGGDATYDALHWVCISDSGDSSKVRPLHLTKGVMKIALVTRQAGVMADEFMLTTDPKCQPAGVYKPTKDLLVVKD